MKRSKKIFLVLSGIFFLIMILIGVDISRRTTFPGSRKLLKESILPSDTLEENNVKNQDILKVEQRKK